MSFRLLLLPAAALAIATDAQATPRKPLVLNNGQQQQLQPGDTLTDASGNPFGLGGVTSVGLSLPSIFSVTGSPITGSGTLTATLAAEMANLVLAGPSAGAPASPTFRALTVADLPAITSLGTVTSGTWSAAPIGAAYGGSGVASPTTHGVLIGEGASPFGAAVLTSGQLLVGQSSGDPSAETLGGDATLSAAGALSVTKTGGTPFGTFATQNYATPPAIGGVTPAAGAFTTLAATGELTLTTAAGGTAFSLGSSAAGSTTPTLLQMDASYSTVHGADPKLCLYGLNPCLFGLGVSSGEFDLIVSSGAAFKFWVGGTDDVTISSAGLTLPGLPTGTPSTYACFTTAGVLISSPTAC